MKKLLVISISAVLMIILTAGVFAESLPGREVVEQGEAATLSGTLVYDDGGWYLESGGDLIRIHPGNQAYLDSIGLELTAGGEAVVRGFLDGGDIAPVTVTLGSEEYRLRDDAGFPLWAGAGQRRDAVPEGRREEGRGPDRRGSGIGPGQRALDGRGPGAFGERFQSCDCLEEG